MNRRDFLKTASIASLPAISFTSMDLTSISLEINLFTSKEISLSESVKSDLKIGVSKALKSLKTDRKTIDPNIKFKNENIDISKRINKNNKNIAWTKNLFLSNDKDIASDSNILLLDNQESDYGGSAILGCPFCIVNTGVVNNGKSLEKFKLENINFEKPFKIKSYSSRSFITLLHEIGHTLGMQHSDGKVKYNNGTLVKTPMKSDHNTSCENTCSSHPEFRAEYSTNIRTIQSRGPPINHKKVRKEFGNYFNHIFLGETKN